jgi:hypothetical protein
MDRSQVIAALHDSTDERTAAAASTDAIALVQAVMLDNTDAMAVVLTHMTDAERVHAIVTLASLLAATCTALGLDPATLIKTPPHGNTPPPR